jgi:hypothetical protein
MFLLYYVGLLYLLHYAIPLQYVLNVACGSIIIIYYVILLQNVLKILCGSIIFIILCNSITVSFYFIMWVYYIYDIM